MLLPFPADKEPDWADSGWRKRGGRGAADHVYHHAEVYGNTRAEAERATERGTCWERESRQLTASKKDKDNI